MIIAQNLHTILFWTIDYLGQKKQISINMKQSDLDFLKQRANIVSIFYNFALFFSEIG